MTRTIDDIAYAMVYENKSDTTLTAKTKMQCEINDLLTALHEAINSPKGVVPKIAESYYCVNYWKQNETN